MFKDEAAWLERELAALPDDGLDPLLSIGSGGGVFRDDKQPWIAQRVYAPLATRGIRVVHHEFAPGPGVDVAGDLGDIAFLDSLCDLGTRAVLCCNVLEHLADRTPLLEAFETLVAPDAYLVLTVPHRFPYHADPIDTMYRPSVADLDVALKGFTLVSGQDLATGTLWRYLRDAPDARASMLNGVRNALSRKGHGENRHNRQRETPDGAATTAERPAGGSATRYFLRTTSVTCAVFRRTPGH